MVASSFHKNVSDWKPVAILGTRLINHSDKTEKMAKGRFVQIAVDGARRWRFLSDSRELMQ